jgi:hypothetical protein
VDPLIRPKAYGKFQFIWPIIHSQQNRLLLQFNLLIVCGIKVFGIGFYFAQSICIKKCAHATKGLSLSHYQVASLGGWLINWGAHLAGWMSLCSNGLFILPAAHQINKENAFAHSLTRTTSSSSRTFLRNFPAGKCARSRAARVADWGTSIILYFASALCLCQGNWWRANWFCHSQGHASKSKTPEMNYFSGRGCANRLLPPAPTGYLTQPHAPLICIVE